MQTITVKRNIDKTNKRASFTIDGHEIAYVKQNSELPDGYYQARMRGFGDLFSYIKGLEDSVDEVMSFISRTFSHEFGIEVKYID